MSSKPEDEVLDRDHLVIEREDVLRDEPFRRRMDVIVGCVFCDGMGCDVHGVLLSLFTSN